MRESFGAPSIDNDIFKRIDRSDLIAADVSIINPESEARKCPNPNVLVEVGYALKVLGEERMILIANSRTTPKPEELPFDIRNRRLFIEGFDKNNTKKVVDELSKILKLYQGYRNPIKTPYVFLTINGVSSNGEIGLQIHNNDPEPYYLEGIEFPGANVSLNENLSPNSDVKNASFKLPNYPFESSFEFFSFTIEHRGERFRIFQKVGLESRADQKFNLVAIEKKPHHVEKI